jgi:aminotransferase
MSEAFLSTKVAALRPSAIRKFFDIVSTMKDVISLGIGEPDFTTPTPILEAGIQSLSGGETHYTSNAGILPLRQAVSTQLKKLYKVDYDPATEIMMTVGVSEAFYLALIALVNPGDEVIVPTPCFVSYLPMIELLGAVPVEIPGRMEDNFELDVDAVKAAISPRTKAILLSYPNNPTGAVASRASLLEVAKLAEKHNLVVISDEIYDRLVYGVEHVCFATLPGMKERTITLGGFSKAYAMTGWRLGYACAPKELINGMNRVHQYAIMCAPSTAQFAGLEALKNGEKYVLEMLAEYDRRRKLIVGGLNKIGLATFEPKGAFYAFPRISQTGLDDETFAERLLYEEKVAVVPGSAFGKGGEGFVRCSYATSYEKIEEALRRIERFVSRLD